MHRTAFRSGLALILLCAGIAVPAMAQTPATRAEVLREERAEKARTLAPYEPSRLERTMRYVEERGIFLIQRDGFYPKFGSLTTGSGFAFGAGFRSHRLFRRYGTLDIWSAASIRRYWATEGRVAFPGLAGGHLLLEGYARRYEYPDEDYFGLGPAARRADQTNFMLRGNRVGARAGVRPTQSLLLGGGIEHLQPRVGAGRSEIVPSIGELFTEASAPGLSRQPDFLRFSTFVEVDYRMPRNARRGGWYRAEFTRFDDRGLDAYSFDRLEVDLRQFVSFLAERRVLAGRMFLSTSDAAPGQQVPFYLMPYLGGNDTLRGFREYRFRGPHAIFLQAEYRWEIWSALEGALFYDAGKVALRPDDLTFKNLEKDYGFGFRFNTNEGVVMRIDAGFGSRDGKHLYIVFGGVF